MPSQRSNSDHLDLTFRLVDATDVDSVIVAGSLFDHLPQPEQTVDFLTRGGHHLVIAYLGDQPVGFATGIEIAHPDKGIELLLYELGVAEEHRRQGIGTQLVSELLSLAERLGCREMWVATDRATPGAIATYRAAGAGMPEDATILSWNLRS